MTEPTMIMALAGFALAALTMVLLTALKGWQGWLDVRRLELSSAVPQSRSNAMERIEVADLKERIRKLESIASCVDL